MADIWFHRYENGRDIEGRFDYNSWVESEKGRRLAASLDKNVVLAEGYKEYDTGRTYMARMGDWRENKDEEIELDGIGGVNILVKADVHRSGTPVLPFRPSASANISRHQFPLLRLRKPSRNRRLCQDGQESRLSGCWSSELRCLGQSSMTALLTPLLITSSTLIQMRSQAMQHKQI